ncbi:BspA family leucine-rich repeat surface protein [Fodinibius sp. Rm-B-1B1-1]|uniref:BspA family leucine-rich repeat surface protein n=1 Tax=Fodinibius alkaliphilus TaxID=3140241 RepID=UPI00315A9268
MIHHRNRLLLFVTLATVTLLMAACGGNSTGPGNANEPTNEAIYQVTLDVTPSDAGTISPSFDSTYSEGEQIQLLANANGDYVFTRWSGDMGVADNPLDLRIDRGYDLTANFELKNYDLAVQTEGKGVVSEVLKQQAKEYEHNTVVELIATPAEDYQFVKWKGDLTGTENPVQVTVDNPKEVTAVFEKVPDKVTTHNVSVSVTPSGSGTISPSTDSTYVEGEQIELIASANSDYVFTGWSGDLGVIDNPLTFTVDKAYKLTANFELKNYDLAVQTEGKGVVSEAINKQAKGYEAGTVVSLVATPAKNYRFVEWKGDLTGTGNPAQITVNNPKNVTAVFEKKSYDLTILTIGQGAVSEQVVQQAKTYTHGTVVELAADTAAGWVFTEWQGDLSGTQNPARITVREKTTIVAKFDLPFYLADNGITILCPDAEVGDTGTVNEVTYTKRSKSQITPASASTTCTSGITDMRALFAGATSFSGDINHWDVSRVTDMSNMFRGATDFNADIGDWDVSSVEDMSGMFEATLSFNQDLGDWDVSNVVNMDRLFIGSRNFNGEISGWDVSTVASMSQMFLDASAFNRDITSWDVSNVTTLVMMFSGASSFNQEIGDWNVSNVTEMRDLFKGATDFNADIGDWDVSSVEDMSGMFEDAESFNQDIGSWNTISVKKTAAMFKNAISFNADIGRWDISNLYFMVGMFEGAESFNQDIGNWDVSRSGGNFMESMFLNATNFNQDLTGWCVDNVDSEPTDFSVGAGLAEVNKPVWGTCPP